MVQLDNIYRWSMIVTLTASFGLASACVSSENADRDDDGSGQEMSAEGDVGEGGGSVYADTISPVEYDIFEQVVESENPKKVTYRLLTIEVASWEAWGRTLRLALDSLVNADPSLVAARATLYEFVPLEDDRGKLVPKAWGEWIPTDGWDAARPGGRDDVHRQYIYHEHPGWVSTSEEQ
jgi:hypothetical protein